MIARNPRSLKSTFFEKELILTYSEAAERSFEYTSWKCLAQAPRKDNFMKTFEFNFCLKIFCWTSWWHTLEQQLTNVKFLLKCHKQLQVRAFFPSIPIRSPEHVDCPVVSTAPLELFRNGYLKTLTFVVSFTSKHVSPKEFPRKSRKQLEKDSWKTNLPKAGKEGLVHESFR